MAPKVTRGSISVFRDLGFSEPEAGHLKQRAELMLRVQQTIRDLGLTQRGAAKALGVRQPRISDLMRGKLHLFSMETLIDMLGRLGIRVRGCPFRSAACGTRPASSNRG
jgi:predicted XRE-type DNA-binding protein